MVAHVRFDPALGGREGIADCDVDVLMRLVAMPRATERELTLGQMEVHVHLEQVTLLLVPVRSFQRDVAAGDAIGQALERGDSFTNASLDCG